jgi:Outer membrane protein beta-barrel domain
MRLNGRLALECALAVVLLGSGVDAQSLAPGPPGPFVIDVRGATSGIPSSPGLYPDLSGTFVVPARGFGADVGVHVYPFGLGPARVGVGVDFLHVRGTATDANATVQTLAPQISFNFGTADGWSYLSAGYGSARVEGGATATVGAVNAGGGARWFLNRHIGVGFDLRLHRLAADGAIMGKATSFSASVGLSLK